jgi:shikimate kinase
VTFSRERDEPIVLVGFMGAGKSAAGSALAARLGWAFADTDALVVQAAGLSIEAIFRESGEGRFREREWDALRSIAGARRIVVATGGGLFLSVAHRELIRRNARSIWLDVPLEVIERRVGSPAGRPLWPADSPLERRALFERRRAAYALADLRVDGSADGAETVAKIVEDRWRALYR